MISSSRIAQKIFDCQRRLIVSRNSSTKIDIKKLEEESTQQIDVFDEDATRREEEIEKKRNKSRLNPQHRRILFDENPYPDGPMHWHHGTLRYNRKLFGKYGKASGVNPAICWPTKQELADTVEYEKVAHPSTITEMMAKAHRLRKEKNEKIAQRQKEIVERMGKLQGWIKEVEDKVAKKEAEVRAAKARRERLIEEVKAHFGYTVDPRDDKFKQLLEKKEKEQKKAMKEERRKAQEAKVMEKLLKKAPALEKKET